MKNPWKWSVAPGAKPGLQLYGNDGRRIVSSMTEMEAVSLKNEVYLALLQEMLIALETCEDHDTAEKVRLRMAEIDPDCRPPLPLSNKTNGESLNMSATVKELIEILQKKDQDAKVEFVVVKTDGEIVAMNIAGKAKGLADMLSAFK